MTTSTNLEITHLVANASDPEVPVNEAIDNLDIAQNSDVTINFVSDADLTLSTGGAFPNQWQYGAIILTDSGVVLTTARNVIVPTNERAYRIVNNTAQTLTIKTSAGTGIALTTGTGASLQCDGANVIDMLPGVGGGIANIVEDLTPQFGAQVDNNGFGIGDGTLEILTFGETASAVNEVKITNAATANAPLIAADGDDTNINLNLAGKGTGQIQISSAYTLPASDGTSGQALVTDGAGGVTFGAPSAAASALDMPALSKSADYTVVGGDQGYLIKSDDSGGVVTITLLAAAIAGDGFTLAVKKMSASNTTVIDGSGAETIDGASTYTLSTQYDTAIIQCDGTSWNVLAEPASGTGLQPNVTDNLSVGFTTDLEVLASDTITPDMQLEAIKTRACAGNVTVNVPTTGAGVCYIVFNPNGADRTITLAANLSNLSSVTSLTTGTIYVATVISVSGTEAYIHFAPVVA